jgi:inorganic pyrophosphatase
MKLVAISIGAAPPDEVNAVVEVPLGDAPIKSELDKRVGALVVDRFLDTPVRRSLTSRGGASDVRPAEYGGAAVGRDSPPPRNG